MDSAVQKTKWLLVSAIVSLHPNWNSEKKCCCQSCKWHPGTLVTVFGWGGYNCVKLQIHTQLVSGIFPPSCMLLIH